MSEDIDPRIVELAKAVIARGSNKRAIAVLRALLEKGRVSTDEIAALGYEHPPRAIGDVRDAGVPIRMRMETSDRTGRRMAVYTFGDPTDIQDGRVGGRSALPKSFKAALVTRYGSIDCITGAALDERVLQIDHRIPYRIAGDVGLADHDVDAYMLLDASSQRSKSWSCERCGNMLPAARDPGVCQSCFWAFPEAYTHIATLDVRRTDIVWQGDDVPVHDRLRAVAEAHGVTIDEMIKRAARQIANDS